MPSIFHLVGQKFGRLIVLSRAENSSTGFSMWNCRCDCGKEKMVKGVSLVHGCSHSCGCLQKEIAARFFKQQSKKNIIPYSNTPEYAAWRHMKLRCSPNNKKCRPNYFNRGIRVCQEWLEKDVGFSNFLQHIGKRPTSAHSVDRIDNNKGYEIGNVRWATRYQQVQNRRKYGTLSRFTIEELEAELFRRSPEHGIGIAC